MTTEVVNSIFKMMVSTQMTDLQAQRRIWEGHDEARQVIDCFEVYAEQRNHAIANLIQDHKDAKKMTLMHPSVMSLLAELATSSAEIIERHFEEDAKKEDMLKHYGPITIEITGEDGLLARFMEEGVDIYPEPKTS